MKVYIVIELDKTKEVPTIVGVYKYEKDAENAAYDKSRTWCNIIEKEVIE